MRNVRGDAFESGNGHGPVLAWDLTPGRAPPTAAVRHRAASILTALAEDHLHAVQLVVSELLANGHDHAGGARGVRLWHQRNPCRVRVEVDDASHRPPVLRAPTPQSLRGRGLVLVDQVARDWGCTSRPYGKTVWAVIDCTAYPWTRCA